MIGATPRHAERSHQLVTSSSVEQQKASQLLTNTDLRQLGPLGQGSYGKVAASQLPACIEPMLDGRCSKCRASEQVEITLHPRYASLYVSQADTTHLK